MPAYLATMKINYFLCFYFKGKKWKKKLNFKKRFPFKQRNLIKNYVLFFFTGHNRLNEYISHYETLDYDHQHIRTSHHRARRSVTKDHYVHLKFQADGRDFHIRLKRDLYTFSNKLEVSINLYTYLNMYINYFLLLSIPYFSKFILC